MALPGRYALPQAFLARMQAQLAQMRARHGLRQRPAQLSPACHAKSPHPLLPQSSFQEMQLRRHRPLVELPHTLQLALSAL